MEKKKIIILVSILLVGIGVSLAYFIGSSMFGGYGSTVEGITANINGAELKIEGNLEFNDLDILPGHKNISSIKVIATGNNELIPYNLIWKGTNSLNTPLKYTVYKTSNEIEVNTTCEKKSKIENGAQILNEECTITNEDKLGNIISSGTINKSEEETKEILVSEEFITATSDGMSVYYYIILEYPNLDEDQNIDMGGTFQGTVTVEESNAKPDINILAVKVEQEDGTYQDTNDIPQSGYVLNTEKSVCSNDAKPSWDMANKRFYADNLTKNGTSCYLYFDEVCKGACKTILAKATIKEEVPNFKAAATSNEGVFKAEDDYGTSYYYRGAVENNYVRFANKYWRIIRINGDGSIRLIYQGLKANSTGIDASIGMSKFNSWGNDNMYVGFKYASGEVHGTGTDSVILGNLNTWYINNLKSYEDRIDANSGFCGDRTPSTNDSSSNGVGGIGSYITYYGGFFRLVNEEVNPSLKCSTEDLYTGKEASAGNKSLFYPIGLISADEASMAGASVKMSSTNFYLYTGRNFWTMTPNRFTTDRVIWMLTINSNMSVSCGVTSEYDVRPVINLRSDVTLTGTGTMTDPYVVN